MFILSPGFACSSQPFAIEVFVRSPLQFFRRFVHRFFIRRSFLAIPSS